MASQVKFTLEEWRGWLDDLELETAAIKGIQSGASATIPILHESTQRAMPASDNGGIGAFDTGRYKRSWKTAKINRGVRIFNDAPYSGVIEKGRRAGAKRPPTAPLEGWARRKLGMSAADAKAAAFAMARAIGARGLKGRMVLSRSMDKIRKVLIREVDRELHLALNNR